MGVSTNQQQVEKMGLFFFLLMLEIKLWGEFRHSECITIFKAQNLKCEKVRPIGGTVKYFYQTGLNPARGQ